MELEGIEESVWRGFLRHFQAQDRLVTVISRVDAGLMWVGAIAELERSGAALDLPTASAHFARRLPRAARSW